MLWLAALTALVPLPSGTLPYTLFAPSQCAYTVSFPGAIQTSEPEGSAGDISVSAELLHNDVRYAALCLAHASSGQSAPSAAALPQIAAMAAMLGVEKVSIRPLDKLSADCGEVDGYLGSERQLYRITARICIEAGFTFIAEATYHDAQSDGEIRGFLDSVKARTPDPAP
jgi:hypothetical protein